MISTTEALDDLRSRIGASYSLLFLKTWEEERWEHALRELAGELDRGFVTWTVTGGLTPPPEAPSAAANEAVALLENVLSYPQGTVFFVKDFHPYLTEPQIVRRLRDLVPQLLAASKVILFVAPHAEVPLELQKDSVSVELPLPGMNELQDELMSVLAMPGKHPELSPDESDRVLKTVLGLTSREARKALARALNNRDKLDDEVFSLLVSEKKSMVSGSDLLDFYDLEEGVKDVGGLDGLKDWITQRSEAFSTRARQQGIPSPKGVLLLGVQGCGKSLTARATARLLGFPLIRLDVANLLSSDRGGTERNMRQVLHLIETISPAVLWLDEIEKGFAGSAEGGGQDATMFRLVGSFLTWMEERRADVFVVATANSVTGLPPEMLRRGRFDEMFFIDLPNYHERKDILGIHLGKRGWKPEMYDLAEIASRSEGYSGAELEQVVVSAMLDAYGAGRVLTDEDLERARDQTVPLSVTMEEKIFNLREWARTRCRRATSDSRVTQMLEEEKRRGEDNEPEDRSGQPEGWENLAEHGQLSAAIVEYVRRHDNVIIPQLQEAFAPYLETTGDQGLALRADSNVLVWLQIGQPLAELLVDMVLNKRVYLHPSAAETYKAIGKQLKLPVIELAEENQKKPCWYPVCLRLLPLMGGSPKLARIARIKLASK